MPSSVRAALLVCVVCACAAADPFVLLVKSVSTQQGVYAESMDVLIRVFNTGDSSAYSVSLKDDDWPASQFEVVKGVKELALPILEAKANASLSFTVRPIFAGAFKPRPATMSYAREEKGALLSHTSNVPPQLLVISRADKYLNIALVIGRVLSLNFVRTARGWMQVVAFWISAFALVGLYKLRVKRQAWRYERALKEMEKMK